jgi:hypothetical protein
LHAEEGEIIVTPDTEVAIVTGTTFGEDYSNAIVIPSSIEYNGSSYAVEGIGKDVFKNTSITYVSLPASLKVIGENAFKGCTSLREVNIPNTVKLIVDDAFSGCTQLRTVTSYITEPWDFNAKFSNLPSDAILYVPAGYKAAYEAVSDWSAFSSIVEMEEESEPDTDISEMDNVIYIDAVGGLAGKTVDLCVKMKNVLTPVGCSFMLTLPEGLRLQTDADGDVVYELSSRARKMSVTMKDWENGSYDFALTPSTATATITGSDDVFITFHVQLPSDMAAGDYKLKLTKCLIQSKEDNITKDKALSDVTVTLTVEDYMAGDVNGDSSVTPSDAIMTLYDYFNVEQAGFNAKAADVNGDGNVTPADAIEILYMYFGSSSTNNARPMVLDREPQ